MAPGLTQIDVFEGPDEISATDTVLAAMTTTLPLATTISNSWWTQIDATSQQLFDVMAAQGQSFFTSSGDSGSYPANTQGVINATSGVTIVGGTNLVLNGAGASYASETALDADGMLSGGGVECCEPNLPIPSYQATISMAANGGSTTNRNAPDVSIVGEGVFIFFDGNYSGFYGTSVSAPLWAAFTALVNQAGAANGAKPIGFANPTLYATASASSLYAADFNDVADHSTNGAYFAVKGYDLVTGLGTPKCELVAQLACVPKTTCGLECGTISNGCGGTLTCPACELHCPRGEGDCGGYCCRCVGTTCS